MSDMPPYLALNDDEENSGEPDSDSSDYEDDLSLSFDKPRHLEPIKGEEREEHSWRVKEKVGAQCLFGNCDVNCVLPARYRCSLENKRTWTLYIFYNKHANCLL